jgi:Ca2+-binding EF-hand superfamily protein
MKLITFSKVALLSTALVFGGSALAKHHMMDPDKAFDKLDTNKDGFVTKDEVKGHPMLEKHFDEVDTNKDGKISKEELEAHYKMMEEKMGEMKGKMKDKMKAADTNKDGMLSRDEVKAAGLKHLEENFDTIDTNKDGQLSKDEMKAYMQSMGKEKMMDHKQHGE